jgi:hypothetical protein
MVEARAGGIRLCRAQSFPFGDDALPISPFGRVQFLGRR